jgi:hypothetical protein
MLSPKSESSDESVVILAAPGPARKTLDLFRIATAQDDVLGLKGGG